MVTLIGVSMTALQGIPGLAEGMMNMAGCVVLPAYVIARLEIQAARRQSQAMLAELEQAHQKLKEYASQAEELASLQERNRLARELHDSTSQSLFSIVFTTRTAQILLERDPEQARAQLQELKNLTQNALVGMRAFITQLKPK
jgi:signal transduction histidine kinase